MTIRVDEMKIAVHVGMHKTGSTAIQNFLWRSDLDGLGYMPWTGPNHCGLFILLFQEESRLAEYHGFRALGDSFVKNLPAMRDEWMHKTDAYLRSFKGDTVVFSAEDISWPGFKDAAMNMVSFFKTYSDDVSGFGYVRESRSFCRSAYQQYLQGADVHRLNFDHLWPNYRGRFEHLDEAFGGGKLELRIFDRHSLHNEDVVQDFLSQLGYNTSHFGGEEDNKSLSAEATALLYVQREFGDGFGARGVGAFARNKTLIDALSKIGRGKFDFDDEVWKRVEEKYQLDIKWISERLGVNFPEGMLLGARKIKSEDDLVTIALESVVELKNAIASKALTHDAQDGQNAVQLINALRALS
ncbi:hypothetical protein [Paracoccus sp. ME4]|uniref:hypothetical protein n=1 Tax=Paracoccus sp. ME4 TaxID=3138066 RepID=UPI00398B64FA